RGIRQPGALLPRPARDPAGDSQRGRRRDLDRPPLRDERRTLDRAHPDRGKTSQGEAWRRYNVHRRRHGCRRRLRNPLRNFAMDLRFSADELAFRDEVRSFFTQNLPDSIRRKMVEGKKIGKDDIIAWQRILNKKGWAVPHWSKEWGGTGWSAVKQYIFLDEMQQAPAPSPLQFGVYMVGPVIIAFGSDAQKKHFLPRIANIDDWWCQGFSEPGAGSDLASLKTTAKRVGDHYVVNGQKTWTTLAQYANWIFCLVRTNPEAKKQEGISFLLID